MTTKPARRYLAKAVPTRPSGHFYAQFAFPGVPPDYVNARGRPALFTSALEAEIAACRALVDTLNNRPGMPEATRSTAAGDRRRGIDPKRTLEAYQRLSGAEASILMAEANLTPSFVSFLLATAPDRLIQWMDANDDERARAPHWFRVAMEIFKQHPETVDTAEEVTNAVTSLRPQVDEFRQRGAHISRLLREIEPHLETADQRGRFLSVKNNADNLTMRERTKILEDLANELALPVEKR